MNESENLRLRQDGGLHSLHIARVGSEDEGLYEVNATNAHGQAHCSAQLYVEEPRTAASGPRYHIGLRVLPAVPLRDPYPEPGGHSCAHLGSHVVLTARSWRRCHPSLRSRSMGIWRGCLFPTSCGHYKIWKWG